MSGHRKRDWQNVNSLNQGSPSGIRGIRNSPKETGKQS